jgi:hypothetical protein
MAEDKKRAKAPTKPRTTDAPGPREAHAERNPGGTPGRGGTTAADEASPLEKEASTEGQGVERGFTTTGSSGSAGGRSTYGLGEDEEEKDEHLRR